MGYGVLTYGGVCPVDLIRCLQPHPNSESIRSYLRDRRDLRRGVPMSTSLTSTLLSVALVSAELPTGFPASVDARLWAMSGRAPLGHEPKNRAVSAYTRGLVD